MKDWNYLAIVADGERIEIEGANVWDFAWEPTGEDAIVVPHPSYPSQQHDLYPSSITVGGKTLIFAAGEVSNCVWCFYVPA